MRERLCTHCHSKPVRGKKRKYCREHSSQASAILKREYRKNWSGSGQKYWMDAWKNRTPEARKKYFRLYMREYRKRKGQLVRGGDQPGRTSL